MFDRVMLVLEAGGNPEGGAYSVGAAGLLSDDEVIARYCAVARKQRILAAEQADLRVVALARGLTTEVGLSAAEWVAQQEAIPGKEARGLVDTSVRLVTDLPLTHEALAQGRISLRHVEVIVGSVNKRNLERVQAIEPLLIDDACSNVTFEAWQATTIDLLKTLDEDGAFNPDEPNGTAKDTVSIRHGRDGSVKIVGHFHGENAAIVAEQLEAGADAVRRRHIRDDEQLEENGYRLPNRNQCFAEALVERLAAAAGKLGTPLVTLRMTTDDPTVATTAAGQRLRGTALDYLLGADTRFRPMIEDSRGVPLWFGSEVRYATEAIREAALNRDGGCVFPGCTAPARWVQVHHTLPFSLGGPTSITYMACLCDHHHRGVIHRRGWVMWPEFDGHDEPTGRFIIQTARGKRMYSQRHGRQPDHPPPDTPAPPWVARVIGPRY